MASVPSGDPALSLRRPWRSVGFETAGVHPVTRRHTSPRYATTWAASRSSSVRRAGFRWSGRPFGRRQRLV